MITIALGSDHAGFGMKEKIVEYIESSGRKVKNCGVNSEKCADYPDIASFVSSAVLSGECSLGILICGTGIGMSIAANKHSGIRAALCSEPFSARFARRHNDANILTFGSRVIGLGLALEIVETFLNNTFEGERHSRRLEKLSMIERQDGA